ncbi:MAG: hypothetical protein V1748_03335 [Actinomycetota bacterium]
MNLPGRSFWENIKPKADREKVPIKDTIRRAVRMCYGHPKEFLGMAAVAALPPFLMMLLIMAQDPENRMSPEQGMVGLLSLILVIASFVLLMYYVGAIPLLTANILDDRSMGWTEGFGWVRDRDLFWGVFLALLLTGFAALGGLILLILPGLIFGTWYMLSVPARVLGGFPGREALSESRRLIEPTLWGSMGLGALLTLPVLLLAWGTQIAFAWMFGFTATSPARVIAPAIVTYAVAIFWGPVAIIGLTLHYLDKSGGLEAQRADLFL